MAKSASRTIAVFLNEKPVENSMKAIAAAQRQVNNELAKMIIGSDEYVAKAADLKKLNTIIAEHRQGLNGIKQGLDLNKVGMDKFIGVAAGAFTVDAVLSFGKQLFSVGVQMDAMAKKAKTVFGEALPLVTDEAEKNARAMGLTNAQYVAAAANIQDLLVPMGFQRKQAAEISTQLLNLSGALSEWTGGQRSAQEVSTILNKALLGERDELKSLGIAINENDVTTALHAKGLDKLTGKLLEQAKASTTLELILAKSTDAQDQFAKGSGSLVRIQAESSAKFQEITERLAKSLIPVFSKLVSIAGGVADAMDYVFNSSARMGKAQETLVTKTQKLQSEFNSEIEVLTKGNFTQAERGKLISEINSKYGEYLPNLLSEKASIDQIREAQDAANKTFSQKIVYLAFEEKLTAVTKAAAEATNLAFESEKRRQELLQKTDFQDNSGLENANKAQIALSQTLREGALQTVKDAPKQVDAIKTVYNQLATELGTTLDALTKKFGAVNSGSASTSGITKEAEKLQKDLLALIERTTELRKDLLSKQTVDEVAIAIRGVEKRYDAEIAKAKELEAKGVHEATAQRLALEQLKAQEISLVTDKFYADEADKAIKSEKDKHDAELKEQLEFLNQKRDERAALELEIKDFEQSAAALDKDNELLLLTEHYNKLLELARKSGFDTVALAKAFEEQKANIVKDSTEKQKEYEKKLAEAKAQLELEKVHAVEQGAAILGGFFEETSALGRAFFLIEKAAAAVSVIISLQKEKAAIWANSALAAGFAGPAAPAVIAALAIPQITAANIRAGINLATIAATAIKPFIKQKFTGGYTDVIGETDGRSYRPQVIGTPSTGLLPNYPVLFQSNATGAPVLASERGSEYFVANKDLRNPAVANYVRLIDDIVTSNGARVRQFAAGGVNQVTTTAGPNPADNALMQQMAANLALNNQLLQYLIANGVVATIPDGTVIGINDRLNTLQKVSGNYY